MSEKYQKYKNTINEYHKNHPDKIAESHRKYRLKKKEEKEKELFLKLKAKFETTCN